jgi:hypothetical protein
MSSPSQSPESDAELNLALLWYNSLSLQQMEFLSTFYKTPVSASSYAILKAYQARDMLRNQADWPETTFATSRGF